MRLSDPSLHGERWIDLGYELVGRRDGLAHLRWTPTERLANPLGFVHGGYVAVVVDDTCGVAVSSLLREFRPFPTASLHLDFYRGVRLGETVDCHGAVTRVGRHVTFAETSLYVDERLVARGGCVFAAEMADAGPVGFSADPGPPAVDLRRRTDSSTAPDTDPSGPRSDPSPG